MMSNDGRTWYCIRGYNGYEYSNDGLLRSMKNFKVNPYGKLIKKYGKTNPYFILSDNNNNRVKVTESEIISIISNDPNPITRQTNYTDIGSRNRVVSKLRYEKDPTLQTSIGIPKFTIIDDNESSDAIRFY